MRQNRAFPTGKNGRKQAALLRKNGVADRKDTVMDAVQTTNGNAVAHSTFTQAQSPELFQCHQAVLTLGGRGDLNIEPTGRNRRISC